MIRLALPVLLLGLAGCTHPGASVDTSADAETARGVECNADKVQDVLGKAQSDAVGADAMKRSGAKILRWIPKDSMVTMDFRVERLNLRLDGAGKIDQVTCG